MRDYRRRARWMHIALLCLTVSSCTSSSEDRNSTTIEGTYTLHPGEEKYYCYTTTLPADRDIAITKMTPTYGLSTHHILVAQTVVPEADGFSECPVLIRDTWIPLYTGGKNSGPLEMPANTGFAAFQRGQQVLMQLHLQNASDKDVTATTSMRFDYVDVTPDLVKAGIYGLDNRKLDIPAHTDAAINTMNCPIDKDLDVFAIMGHMHKHGAHLAVSRGAAANDDMLYSEDWNFETQPVTPSSFHVAKNDNVFLQCTHKNEGDTPIMYGESSDTEMCSFVMFYAPSNGLDGCINQ